MLVVAAVFAAAGFQWVDGLRATLPQYAHSVARLRPQNYFVYGNLGAFALVLGPAAGAGLGRLRDRRAWLVVGSAMAAVLLADLSGLSKGEAERIWIPFVPWVLIAAGALATRDTPARAPAGERPDASRPPERAGRARVWLAATAATGLALAFTLRIP